MVFLFGLILEVSVVKHNKMSATKQKYTGKWNQLKGRLKEEYANITDNDLQKTEGKLEQVVGMIQEKTGETKEKIKNFIDNF